MNVKPVEKLVFFIPKMYNTGHRKVNTLKNKLVKLFFSTLYLSAFTFGGGYVIVSLMRKKFVDEYNWIDEDEMLDLVAIAQSAPGPIAVNGAIVVGYKMAGLLGIFISVLATIIPPFVIISVISVFYEIFKTNLIVSLMLEGMQAGVGAVIASVCFEMGSGLLKEKNKLYPVIKQQVITAHHWLSVSEFTDLISISQMTPGPIAVNSATFVGIKIADIPGAICATIGCVLPSCIIVGIISYFYLKYRHMDKLQSVLKMLRPAVVALIATAGVSILTTAFFGESFNTFKIHLVVIFGICVILLTKYKWDPILVMLLAGVMNTIYYFI